MFIETSAVTGQNVSEAFVNVARRILNNMETVSSGVFEKSEDEFKEYRSADNRRPYLRRPSDTDSCSC